MVVRIGADLYAIRSSGHDDRTGIDLRVVNGLELLPHIIAQQSHTPQHADVAVDVEVFRHPQACR
jgi:hypothetical protein